MRLLLLGLLLFLSASVSWAKEGALFPRFKGRSLAGKQVTADQLRGKPHLVVVGFERAHAKALRGWAQGFRARLPEAAADYLEIAVMPGKLSFMRGFIEGQMKKDVPSTERGRILTCFAADSLCRELSIKDRKKVYVYLLDAEGRILDTAAGEPDPAALDRFSAQLVPAPSGKP